jgi:hypothetical protein
VTYNLPDVADLKLDGATIADSYMGTIKKWNDAKIGGQNPGVTLPATDILPVYRSDGSGTTAIFADFVAKVHPGFKERVGTGTSLSWPAGVGAKGNEGVTGLVKQTPGSLGYVELIRSGHRQNVLGASEAHANEQLAAVLRLRDQMRSARSVEEVFGLIERTCADQDLGFEEVHVILTEPKLELRWASTALATANSMIARSASKYLAPIQRLPTRAVNSTIWNTNSARCRCNTSVTFDSGAPVSTSTSHGVGNSAKNSRISSRAVNAAGRVRTPRHVAAPRRGCRRTG